MATFTINIASDRSVVFDADYLTLTYSFTDGRDLDIRAAVVVPDIGQNMASNMIGWGGRWRPILLGQTLLCDGVVII